MMIGSTLATALCQGKLAHFFGTSFIPHLGQVPGLSATTSGCMEHVYVAAAPAGAGAFLLPSPRPRRVASADMCWANSSTIGSRRGRISFLSRTAIREASSASVRLTETIRFSGSHFGLPLDAALSLGECTGRVGLSKVISEYSTIPPKARGESRAHGVLRVNHDKGQPGDIRDLPVVAAGFSLGLWTARESGREFQAGRRWIGCSLIGRTRPSPAARLQPLAHRPRFSRNVASFLAYRHQPETRRENVRSCLRLLGSPDGIRTCNPTVNRPAPAWSRALYFRIALATTSEIWISSYGFWMKPATPSSRISCAATLKP